MMKFRHALMAFAAATALFAGPRQAADKFPVGQDTRFSWKSFEDFKASHARTLLARS